MSLCKHQTFKKLKTARSWCASQKENYDHDWEIFFCKNCYRWGAKRSKQEMKSDASDDCQRKIRYKIHAEAREVADYHNTHGDNWVGVYKCSYCKGYHVGHLPMKVREKILGKFIEIGREALNG